MAMPIEEMMAKRRFDPAVVGVHKKWMLGEVRAYRRRELREASFLTLVQVAERLRVTQNRFSRIEPGDIDRAQVDTLRKYVDAIAGTLRIEIELGDERSHIA